MQDGKHPLHKPDSTGTIWSPAPARTAHPPERLPRPGDDLRKPVFLSKGKKGTMLTASGTKCVPQARLGQPAGRAVLPPLGDGSRRCCHAQETSGPQLSAPAAKQRLSPPSRAPVMTWTGVTRQFWGLEHSRVVDGGEQPRQGSGSEAQVTSRAGQSVMPGDKF